MNTRLILSLAAGIAGFVMLSSAASAAPIGFCGFDPARMAFAGTPAQQASCLLRRIRPRGAGSDVQPIAPWLLERLGAPVEVSAESLIAFLDGEGISQADLGGPVVAGDASQRRYFVIHDTSSPVINAPSTFPANINEPGYEGNKLTIWSGMVGQVNLVVTRDGRSRTLTDWKTERSISATKLEQKRVLPASRKVFVHVENVQPRIKPPGAYAWISPKPAFTPPQMRRLALAYVTVSLRAGRWLVPALHYNLDKDSPAGSPNDDPQGFDLKAWVDAVQAVTQEVQAGATTNKGEATSSKALASTATWPAWVDLGRLVDLDEAYRAEFRDCDINNRFRGYALPAKIGARMYYGCKSDPNALTALRSLPAGPGRQAAIAFTGKLSVDLDGSWYACNTPGKTDQCGTALMPRNRAGVEAPVSSDFVPYVVIPTAGPTQALSKEFRNLSGVAMGDFGVLLTADAVIPVIVADGGPFSKIGEGSIALHRRLGKELCATKDAVGQCKTMRQPVSSLSGPFVTILFPGSRIPGLKAEDVASTVQSEGQRLWEQVRGEFGR